MRTNKQITVKLIGTLLMMFLFSPFAFANNYEVESLAESISVKTERILDRLENRRRGGVSYSLKSALRSVNWAADSLASDAGFFSEGSWMVKNAFEKLERENVELQDEAKNLFRPRLENRIKEIDYDVQEIARILGVKINKDKKKLNKIKKIARRIENDADDLKDSIKHTFHGQGHTNPQAVVCVKATRDIREAAEDMVSWASFADEVEDMKRSLRKLKKEIRQAVNNCDSAGLDHHLMDVLYNFQDKPVARIQRIINRAEQDDEFDWGF
jgi:hypothetical protein